MLQRLDTPWLLFIYTFKEEHAVAYEFLTRAVEVIEWGRAVWKNVPEEDRGATFALSFLRAVRTLRMDISFNVSMLVVIHTHILIILLTQLLGLQPNNTFVSLDALLDEAEDIIDEVKANPPDPGMDPGFYLSFWDYVEAEAYS